jgi:predicted nucleic acid-binding protein
VIRGVLLHTGPLIALIDQRDKRHARVEAQFDEVLPPLLTCEAVVTEACHLARRIAGGTQAVLDLFARGVVRLAFDLDDNFASVSSLMQRYANVPMSLADACLVRMSELVPKCVVFTLDRDFRIYRRHKREKIPLLIAPAV